MMFLPLCLLSALLGPQDDDPALAPPADAPRAAALQLSSMTSMRAARLNADGSVDSGLGVLQLLDGETGQPLDARNLRYGPMPDLWAGFTTKVQGADVEVRLLAIPVARGGDERVKVSVRTAVANRTDEPMTIKLAAVLKPGGGDPMQRPAPSVEFKPESAFAQDGKFITRDGHVLLGYTGTEPQITVKPAAASADEEVVRFDWTLEVGEQNARLVELSLAGPPARDKVDESAWREGFKSGSYAQSEEQLGWQSGSRGHYADIQVHDPHLWYVLVAALQNLRAMGDADKEIRGFSDRPFGHPASDAAVDAEVLGLFGDWGWGDWTVPFMHKLLDEAVARGKGLPPERRVALLHGLARCVRLGVNREDTEQLAGAIHALLDASAEGAVVRPWLDPEVVRLDLQAILDGATPLQGYELPHFKWATPAEGSREATFVAIRRAVSAHDGEQAWRLLEPLVAATSDRGFGSMVPGGVADAAWSLAFMSVMRDMLIDDHGADLHVFPAISMNQIPARGALEIPMLPSRFGPLEMKEFLVAKKLFGIQVIRLGSRQPRLSRAHMPAGYVAEAVLGPMGGQATLLPDGEIDCIFEPSAPQGLRFNVRLTKEH